jgi:hypothetical protein
MQSAMLGHLEFAVYRLADDRVAGDPEEQVLRTPLHGRKFGEVGIQIGEVEAGGMELLVEPIIESDGADNLNVTGPRSEGEAVQGVQNAGVAL